MELDSDQLRRVVRGAPWLWISTRPRAAAAAVAFLGMLSAVALFEASQPWRLLAAAEPRNHAAHDTRLLTTLAWVGVSGIDTVILVGGSTARELPPSEARLSGILTERCGRPIRFVNGATTSQTLAESWMITEAVPDERRALTIVGMNYLRFEEGFAEVARDLRAPLLPLRTPEGLERVLIETGHPPASALPGLTATAWLLPRIDEVDFNRAPEAFDDFKARRTGQTPWQGPQNIYSDPPLNPAAKATINQQMVAERLSLFEARRGQAGALWRAFVRRFAVPQSDVIFLALPEDPSMAPFAALARVGFAEEMAALDRAGARVTDWRTNHGLVEEDFYDQQHLIASGRRKLEPRLVQLISSNLTGCDL
jgi:hypothetical protein